MSTPANSEFDLIQDSSDVFTAATRSNESGASGCLWFLYLRRRHSPPQSPTIRHYRLRIEPPKSVRVSPRIGRFNLKWAGPSSSSSNTPITIQPVIVWSRGLRKISHSLISILSMNGPEIEMVTMGQLALKELSDIHILRIRNPLESA